MPLANCVPQDRLRVRLDRMVERQVDVLAVSLGARGDRVDGLAGGVLDDPLATRAARELLVERELEACEATVVNARIAEHL
jgi:hypothetical protein